MVTAGGAVSLPQLARSAVKAGRLGLEFLVGIPGSVGGAIRQNAGCFGREMVDVTVAAEVFDLAAGRFPPELAGSLWQQGMIGDDEEYWPFEGEYWADEYEGWR